MLAATCAPRAQPTHKTQEEVMEYTNLLLARSNKCEPQGLINIFGKTKLTSVASPN